MEIALSEIRQSNRQELFIVAAVTFTRAIVTEPVAVFLTVGYVHAIWQCEAVFGSDRIIFDCSSGFLLKGRHESHKFLWIGTATSTAYRHFNDFQCVTIIANLDEVGFRALRE